MPTIVTSCKVACFEEWLRLFEKDAARRETFCNNAKTRWFVNGDEIVVIMHDMNPARQIRPPPRTALKPHFAPLLQGKSHRHLLCRRILS